MKSRSVKESELQVLQREFADARSLFLVEFRGLKVAAVDDLRRKVREARGRYRVVKNTLARRACKGTPAEQIAVHFKGPTAMVSAGPEPATLARTLTEFAKNNPAVTLKAGMVDGAPLDAQGCKAVAELPSREVLLGRLLHAMQSPLQRLVTVLQAPARDLVVVLGEQAKKKAEGPA